MGNDRPRDVLICGTNWLGDSVMSMPAVQCFKRHNPSVNITMLVRRKLIPLWEMHTAVDAVVPLDDGMTGTLATVARVKRMSFARAYIFPNSFRSALVPFLAGVPVRRGLPGHYRSWMLTEVARLTDAARCGHQAWEYMEIMGANCEGVSLENPMLEVPPGEVEANLKQFCVNRCLGLRIGMAPGAARGPSKRWPASHFAKCGRLLVEAEKCSVLVFGTEEEQDLCSFVAAEVGAAAFNLAGKTSLRQLAVLLKSCAVAITNDSGTMHLAAAVGTPVVAIFGITDPTKTGPLGSGHRILTAQQGRCSRDVPRASAEAEFALTGIRPEEVVAAARSILARREQTGGASLQ